MGVLPDGVACGLRVRELLDSLFPELAPAVLAVDAVGDGGQVSAGFEAVALAVVDGALYLVAAVEGELPGDAAATAEDEVIGDDGREWSAITGHGVPPCWVRTVARMF